MKYANKSSAARAAKQQFGGEWQTKAFIDTDAEGKWLILPMPVQAPAGEKTDFTLAEALEESGESMEELTEGSTPANDPKKADGLANRLAMGWKLSTTEKPTKKVWTIASAMPGASRKEVIAACEAAGIGAGTSRTQYQAWFSAMKASGLNPRG
ncbi:MAG: hypothetical protein WAV48_06700 [Candidatus Magasanikiibacteriota bacterium]